MANEAGKPKKVRAKKPDWTGTGKLRSRVVTGFIGSEDKGTRKSITYTEYKLVGVTSLEEAAQVFKLKGLKAVGALTLGVNQQARRQAAGDSSLALKLAERKGITLEEARAILA